MIRITGILCALVASSLFCGVRADEQVKILCLPLSSPVGHGHSINAGSQMTKLLSKKLSDANYAVSVGSIESDRSSFNSAKEVKELAELGRSAHSGFTVCGSVKEISLKLNPQVAGSPGGFAAGRGMTGLSYAGGIAGALSTIAASLPPVGKVTVSVDLVVVDNATEKEFMSATATATSKRLTPNITDGKQTDFNSKNFNSTAVGEAVNKCLDSLVSQIDGESGRLKSITESLKVRGTVCDVDSPYVCVGAGKTDGISVGDTLKVDRQLPGVDSAGTPMIGTGLTNSITSLKVTDVGEHSSLCQADNGDKLASIAVGDFIRREFSGVDSSYANSSTSTGGTVFSTESVNAKIKASRRHESTRSSAPSATSTSGQSTSGMMDKQFGRAVSLYDAGSYEGAQAIFTELLKQNPSDEMFTQISQYLKDIKSKLHSSSDVQR